MADSNQSTNKVKGLVVFFVNDNFDDQKYNVSNCNTAETEATAKKLRDEEDYTVQYYSNLTIDQILKRMDTVAQEDHGEDSTLSFVIKSHMKKGELGDSAMARDGWYEITKISEILDSNTSKWKGKETQLILDSYDNDEVDFVGGGFGEALVVILVYKGIKKVFKATPEAVFFGKDKGQTTENKKTITYETKEEANFKITF